MLRKPFTRIDYVLTSNGYFNHYEPEETFDLTVNKEYSPDDNALETSLLSKNTNGETAIKLTLKLTVEMKDLIKSYTLCDLDVPSQIRLLRGLFPEAWLWIMMLKTMYIKRAKNPDWYVQPLIDTETNSATNTYNLPLSIFAVVDNNFRSRIVVHAVMPDETSESYKWILQQTIEAMGVQPGAFIIDADPGLESVVPEVYPDTYLLYCIWHIGRNIEKQLVKSLGDRYADFLKAFYSLDSHKTTWAFTDRIFTAGITTIQHSESINSVIKRTVNERTQLHMLFKRIKTRVAEEHFVGQFAAWREKMISYITPSIPSQLFPNVYSILQKYIMPKILQLHVKQMNKAVMYYGKIVEIGDLNNLTLDTVNNKSIEFEYNFCQICLNELLDRIDQSLITEVWEFKSIKNKLYVGQHISDNAFFHISLIPKRWYKDEMIDLLVVSKLFVRGKSHKDKVSTLYVPSFSDVAESWNSALTEPLVQTTAKAIGQKQSVKGTLLGLARKCVESVNYDDLNDSNHLIKIFKK
ncbi:30668_t:CDS:2 [Gigaspora margarita]|uniref:30668_t:CDS:1 n=1 Tax=Gigaspora margarita TaxID=4874 RepID=A0ABN7WPX9_GIGMA|nr:30668_t:CDS:2 [Gigaspora margarita]